MANRILDTRLRLKYDTAANWATKNPVLLAGEVGIEKDTLSGKVGDGTSTWQQLGYLNADNAKRVPGNFVVIAGEKEGGDILYVTYNGEEERGLAFSDDLVGRWLNNEATGEPEKDCLWISLAPSVKDILNGALRFDIAQSLTDAQKAQARTNIGASGSDTGATSVEVTGNGNAVTGASYNSSTRKLTLTKGTTFQEKLTAGTNITISGNTISSKNTDTGATSVETTGTGNAFTAASYDASTRKITFTKGTTFLTSVKTLKTDNAAAQSTSSGEAIGGSGTINLHKVSKTGSYNDLLNRPTKLSDFTDDKVIKFTNTSVAASAFVADTSYSNYGYCASVGLSGVTANDTADVYFSGKQVEQEIYASFCESYAGGVKIYAAEKPSEAVIIPLILIHK